MLESSPQTGAFPVLASRLRAGGLGIRYPSGRSVTEAVVGVGLTACKGERAPAAIAANDKRIRIFDFFITVSSLFLWIFESL